ncbi:hypothetical protein CEUSTIGMA_g5981.t1 [Chlamydomonas eustigma]|uniref:Uncharacterized protein n=1 Tax=Chlamydomonas eustigma TaxID=1157962 RepID=A0A250X641_9CHLO|nr:hypothetical protein CEUSTIGMA_g5981.t1 [Chlamydomonas eustigma]|eukprot:GAX78541.1 hypothetical protein CEUSTIGMA_g5981.t1 [Chlamydomonas eustigma]
MILSLTIHNNAPGVRAKMSRAIPEQPVIVFETSVEDQLKNSMEATLARGGTKTEGAVASSKEIEELKAKTAAAEARIAVAEARIAAAEAVLKEQLRAVNEAAEAKAQAAVHKEQLRAANEAAEAKAQAAVHKDQLRAVNEAAEAKAQAAAAEVVLVVHKEQLRAANETAEAKAKAEVSEAEDIPFLKGISLRALWSEEVRLWTIQA